MFLCEYEVVFLDGERDIIVSQCDIIKISIMSPFLHESSEYIGKFMVYYIFLILIWFNFVIVMVFIS